MSGTVNQIVVNDTDSDNPIISLDPNGITYDNTITVSGQGNIISISADNGIEFSTMPRTGELQLGISAINIQDASNNETAITPKSIILTATTEAGTEV